MWNIDIRIHIKQEVNSQSRLIGDPPSPQKWHMQKFKPQQKILLRLTILTHVKNILTPVKNILTLVTYATHVKIWPMQPAHPHNPRNPLYHATHMI